MQDRGTSTYICQKAGGFYHPLVFFHLGFVSPICGNTLYAIILQLRSSFLHIQPSGRLPLEHREACQCPNIALENLG